MGNSIELDELERLAKAATPGPWKLRNGFENGTKEVFRPDSKVKRPFEVVELATVGTTSPKGKACAKFIAAANPDTVLELVRRLREAEKDTERLDLLDRELTLTIQNGRLVGISHYDIASVSGRNSIRADIDAVMQCYAHADEHSQEHSRQQVPLQTPAVIPTQITIAPRGYSWHGTKLIHDELGTVMHPTKSGD